jgi:hypothetical protein
MASVDHFTTTGNRVPYELPGEQRQRRDSRRLPEIAAMPRDPVGRRTPSAAAEYRSHPEPGRARRLHSRHARSELHCCWRSTPAPPRTPREALKCQRARGVLRRVYGDVTNDGGPEGLASRVPLADG